MSFQRITSSKLCRHGRNVPPDEMLLTLLAPIWPDLSMCPFVSIEMFLFMTYPRTKSALFLHWTRSIFFSLPRYVGRPREAKCAAGGEGGPETVSMRLTSY